MHGFISFVCLIIFILLSNSASAQEISLVEPVEGWDELVRQSNVETKYQVKKGDNLYDISDILFGDAHYWPKVWSLNRSLTNPHEIEEGQIVYFDSGNIAKPPSLSLSQNKEGAFLLAESYREPVIPKQAPRVHMKKLPGTFPSTYGGQAALEAEQDVLAKIEVGERLVLKEREAVTLYTEIMAKKPESIGQVQITEDDSLYAKIGDFVVVNLKSSVALGQKLSVYTIERSEDFYSIISWLGEVEIIKPVGNKGDTYKALVLSVNKTMFKGAKLSLERLKTFSYKSPDDEPALSIKNLKILGGEGKLKRSLFNDGDLVYLNRGRDDGISNGDVYYVSRSLNSFFTAYKAKDIPGSSALVKIIASDGRYSTGVLYNMTGVTSSGVETRTTIY